MGEEQSKWRKPDKEKWGSLKARSCEKVLIQVDLPLAVISHRCGVFGDDKLHMAMHIVPCGVSKGHRV